KAAATLLLTIRGTPLLYYGQELGMVDNTDIPEDQLQDHAVVKSDTGETPPPRDGARTPMQWDASAHAGFSFGKAVQPWLPVHANYPEVNVQSELTDPDSILNFYRRLLRVRQHSPALQYGCWRSLIHYPHEHMAYLRETETETVLIAINFAYEQPFTLDVPLDREAWTVLLSTDHEVGKAIDLPDTLQAFEVTLLQKTRE
ncbi:MAG: alpha-glucosidase C-terminal domain-containing protein, partial [Cyanobacteria bacterium P01_D01_bin.128]